MSERHPSPSTPCQQHEASRLLAQMDDLIERIAEQLEEIDRVATNR